ncbi:MAG: response regulator [Clostridia bacterium]|nr:response regulator [Deltaproteobacteria bacterium]
MKPMATKIVLVDDSLVALEWAREALAPLGFDVVTYNASLGIQAFVRKNQPRLVLLDVHMPALNGDLVCRMLKESPQTKDVVVALYSSMPEEELQQLASKSGADGYIVKTSDVDVLSQQLEKLLSRAVFAPS